MESIFSTPYPSRSLAVRIARFCDYVYHPTPAREPLMEDGPGLGKDLTIAAAGEISLSF
jgi:hypothetical protein